MIELAERPADTSPPRQPGGWYDPDSSAFEPLAAAPMTDEVATSLEPAGTGYRVSVVERVAGDAVEARSGLPTRRTTSSV